jgi:uncharacterized protein YkwD
MRCLINATRGRRGLRPLRRSARLDRSAELRARAIRRCRDFSHTPCGRSFTSVYVAAGYSLATHAVAENLAWGQGRLASPSQTFRAWLRSPPHRENMLEASWRKIGLAVVRVPRLGSARNAIVWVAEFGAP